MTIKQNLHFFQLFTPTKRAFGPVVEKLSTEAFLTEDPVKILREGKYNKVPIMIGCNNNEGLLYEVARRTRNLKGSVNFENEIPHNLGVVKSEEATNVAEKIKKFYKIEELSSDEKTMALYDVS